MKTILELRAKKEDEYDFNTDPRNIFRDGWDEAVKELTRWHDPKKELPEIYTEVLVYVRSPYATYDVMLYDEQGWWQKAPGGGWCAPNHDPIGWRYIEI